MPVSQDEDATSAAVRKIVCALCEVDPQMAFTAPVLRQAIFYIWEGGEAGKWRTDRPYSASARKVRNLGVDRTILRYDHAIPLATIRQRLCDSRLSPTEFKAVLKRYVRSAVLTNVKDALLSLKFRSSMPESAAPDDAMARYRAVGIIFDPAEEDLLTRNPNMPE